MASSLSRWAVPILLGVMTIAASDARARSVRARGVLSPTAAAPGAAGTARLQVRDGRRGVQGRFEVRARGLAASTGFEVRIDDVAVGTFQSSRRGRGRARFDSREGKATFLGVDPRGRAVAIVQSDGSVVLTGRVSDDSIDPNDHRCCLPDDSGTECEDRTAAECAAQGGVDLGPGSCFPMPCASGGAGDPDIRCCLPDDSGPDCEDRTAAQCAAQGGVNLGPGSCSPNPCAGSVTTTTSPGGTTTTRVPVLDVVCERRSDRSKISVDANNVASGSYRARVTSAGNEATSGLQSTIGDEVEFDFDSQPDDIAAGATPIAAGFIQGTPPAVQGTLLDASGAVVLQVTRSCASR